MAKASKPTGGEVELRDFCARLMKEPERLDYAMRLLDARPLKSKPHAHGDLIQFDLALGCGGSVETAVGRIKVRQATALVFYPDDKHSHDLVKLRPETEVLTMKIRVTKSWPAVARQIFPRVVLNVQCEKLLAQPFRRLAWLSARRQRHSAVAMAVLAEILALWRALTDKSGIASEDWRLPEPGMQDVLKLIDQNLNAPPSVEEMAEVAKLSLRQFRRRFQSALGCSPHAYLSTRRLSYARELLNGNALNITQVARELGFSSVHGFSRWFRREADVNASSFRRQNVL
jgi:AraC-like DNA-binding protein